MAGTVAGFPEALRNKTDQTDKPFPPQWSLGGATSEKHTKSVTLPGKVAGAGAEGEAEERGVGRTAEQA